MHYSWPGNVRQLFNTLERAALMSDTPEIQASDLELLGPASEPLDLPALGLRLPDGGMSYRQIERSVLVQALERVGWVQKDAAHFLGMSRRRLNYRIRRLGITHPGWRSNVARTETPESGRPAKVC